MNSFTYFNVVLTTGSPLGTYVGGLLLKDTPNTSGGQLHNYITIISVSLIMQITAFILLLLLINEKKSVQLSDDQTLINNEIVDSNGNEINTLRKRKPTYQRVDSSQTLNSESPKKW